MLAVDRKFDYAGNNEENQPWFTDNKTEMNMAVTERTLPESAVALNIAEVDKNITQELNYYQQQKQQHRENSSSSLRKNVPDVIIFIIVSVIVTMTELDLIPRAKLGFTCKDPKISYPFRGDTMSTATVTVVSMFTPLILIYFIEILRKGSYKRICISTVWYYYKKALTGLFVTLLLSEIIKLLLAEPRPHFLDSCKPDTNQYCQPGTFVIDYNCTNKALTNYLRGDIERSFPSSHTSFSMFASLYCAYLIHSRLINSTSIELLKPILIIVCLLWTCVCSFTRITDRRHHWWDVLGGAILGVCGAFYIIYLIRKQTENNHNNNHLVKSNPSTRMSDMKKKNSSDVINNC